MRADYLKRRGDEAVRAGNNRDAIEAYTACLEASDENDAGMAAVLSNRSLACCRAGRHADALADAERVIRARPDWSKGYWRKAAALKPMKERLEAVRALAR